MNKQSENEAILESYCHLFEFLASFFGEQCELVLFRVDAAAGNGKVMRIRNTDGALGGEMGPIGKRILAESDKGYQYLVNVNKSESETQRQRKLSYFLIRNSDREVIGMLLMGFAIDYMIKAKSVLDQFLGYQPVNENPVERFDLYHELETEEFSIGKYAAGIIRSVIAEGGIAPERMTMDEKAEVIRKLEGMEVFHIRGSVKEAAAQLLISIATVYRLMKRQP